MADSPSGNAGNPFSGLTGDGNGKPAEGSSNDPFERPANGSAAPPPKQPATVVGAPAPALNSTHGTAGNGNGLPFKVSGQTEPVKVSKGTATSVQPASDETTSDPFRREPETPEVSTPPEESTVSPASYSTEDELPPNRVVDDRRAEEERIEAHTQRLHSGQYGYVPYAYEEERKPLFRDPRIWGSLLAATAIGVILAVVIVVAGGDDGKVAGVSDEVSADVVIEAPEEGATVAAGQPFLVRAVVTHPDGIEQVDLQVNGSPTASDTPDGGGEEPPSNFTAEMEWTPEDEGQYTLAVVGVTPDGERFGEEQRVVNVAFAAGTEAFVVALDPTNVREYPSTDERSQSFGQLQPGEERRILQRTSTGAGGWFLIEFPASPTGQGWVLEQLVDTRGDLTTVESVEPPALPTPEPTPTETPSPTASATPEGSGEFDLEPAGYDEDEGYVEIKNNGPGDFRGYIVLFYLTADTSSGCQLDTQSGNYPIEGIRIAANQVVSVRFNTPQPDGLFCIGISVENDQDPENNAIGPYQKTG
ncbi:MAG TPA: Ig-like domain-containing protein [Dehalococcoidia bacterium]|nr:Ig-like domain-containing protein [Dehalococcoidia bacterium]